MTVRLPPDDKGKQGSKESTDSEKWSPPVPSSSLDTDTSLATSTMPGRWFKQPMGLGGFLELKNQSLSGDEKTRRLFSFVVLIEIYIFAASMVPFCYTKDTAYLKWPLYILLFAGFSSVALRSGNT